VSTEIEKKKINLWNLKTQHGYDEISVKIPELSSQFITSPLTYIYV
jgi:hypothetical protein